MDFEAQRIIEALRSGVSSRAVGHYFSTARPELMEQISCKLDRIRDTGESSGMVVSGKYGEGKTHLLNTVFNLAHSNNMVVSLLSLSKETPLDKLYLTYQKLVSNTYLPGRLQPGFQHVLQDITLKNPLAQDLLAFTSKHLDTDKLFFVLRSYLGVDDPDEKYLLMADLEGDFINNTLLRQIYKRIFDQSVRYSVPFSKTRHSMDYFSMLSNLFKLLGFNGWVILYDETELIGRLGKKARLIAYNNMAAFLFPEQYSRLKSTFTMFAMGASYREDVIESKHDFENLTTAYVDRVQREPIEKVLNHIISAPQLQPLNQAEILQVLKKVQVFHGRAYDWKPNFDVHEVFKASENRGYLLRTRIRAAVELLDQLYQYGQAGDIRINDLGEPQYQDEELTSLEDCIIDEN
ncbi:MAG: BREX system ATP-binding domain-containing protein [Desulfitobacteriaceae bacterium]